MSSRRPGSKVATPVPSSAENGSSDSGATNGRRNSVVLGPKDRLVGQLYIEGDLHVSGSVDGSLEATGDIEIARGGKVNGQVTAYNRLVVGSDASLIGGDVRVARLTVEDGATFTGHVSMGRPEPKLAPAPEPVVAEPAPLTPAQILDADSKRRRR